MEKKTKFLIVLLILCIPMLAMAQVTIVPPTVTVPSSVPFYDVIEGIINDQLDTAANDMENQINTEIGPYIGQDSLVTGFANAGAAAAHSGTQRAYNDYKAFALTVGTGFALSAPSSDPSILEQALADIETEGDIYFGAAFQPVSASLGINMGWLVDDLYATVKFGYANLSDGTISQDFSFKTMTIGTLLNYQLLQSRQLPLGFIRWRGLSLGSGVLYQSNESVFKIEFPIDDQNVSFDTGYIGTLNADLTVAPELTIGASSKSVSIPLEATTGFRLLWLLDISVGAGVDIAFGSSAVDLAVDSPVIVEQNSTLDLTFNEGSVSVDAGTDGDGPQIMRPRLTAGVGLNLGPVKIDFPMMYYLDSEGVSAMVGANVGIVW